MRIVIAFVLALLQFNLVFLLVHKGPFRVEINHSWS